MVFHWFSYVFDLFPVDFNRRPSPDPRFSYDFLWFSIGFPIVLLCFRFIFIVGPRPIFGYLMISCCFPMVFLCFCCYVPNWFSSALARSSVIVWFPIVFHRFFYGFAMFPVDFNRRPSPDLRFIVYFLMVSLWFSYGVAMFSVDFNRRPSHDLR